jgi:hypothetical protein
VTLDVVDIDAMSNFWASALDYRIVAGDDGCATLKPRQDDPALPTVWLQAVDHRKVGKNRCHVDLVSSNPSAEVQRLGGLGATPADVGQKGDEGFDVLADPEGNEFCVLHRVDGTVAQRGAALDDPDAPGLSVLGAQPAEPVEPNEPA